MSVNNNLSMVIIPQMYPCTKPYKTTTVESFLSIDARLMDVDSGVQVLILGKTIQNYLVYGTIAHMIVRKKT
jgi:hypothetical protein